jgi:hypothetical protein
MGNALSQPLRIVNQPLGTLNQPLVYLGAGAGLVGLGGVSRTALFSCRGAVASGEWVGLVEEVCVCVRQSTGVYERQKEEGAFPSHEQEIIWRGMITWGKSPVFLLAWVHRVGRGGWQRA